MKTIPVKLSGGRGYDIAVGLPLKSLGARLRGKGFSPRVLVISVPPVARRYAAPLLGGLRGAGFLPHIVLMRDREEHKNLDAAKRLFDACIEAQLDRKGVIVALGGGVVGDVAGFVAATFLRGVAFVQCPTTLLAMVDASIGGKVAVDLPAGKNLVGAFHQPKLVAADLSVLKSLPPREWRTGMAEVIKYGFIADAKLLDLLERVTLDDLKTRPALLEDIVARSAAIKARVVSKDERETKGLREILNLGHTFGHAIESVTGYGKYTHGEAISIGMAAAARLSHKLGLVPVAYVFRTDNILNRWGLPVRVERPLPRAKILSAMSRDKKTIAGMFRFVVSTGPGRAKVVKDIPKPLLNGVLADVGL